MHDPRDEWEVNIDFDTANDAEVFALTLGKVQVGETFNNKAAVAPDYFSDKT